MAQATAGRVYVGIHKGGESTRPDYAMDVAMKQFGTVANQLDEALRVPFTIQVVGYGAMGDVLAVDLDDGGAAVDYDNAATFIDVPFYARIIDTQTQLAMAAADGRQV